VYRRLVATTKDTARLLEAFGAMARTRHVQVSSAVAAEQAVLERTPAGGVLPVLPGKPFLLVTTQNSGGNKLDYYLRREVRYDHPRRGVTRVEVRLTNLAPPGLPEYIGGRQDLRPADPARPPGEQHVYLSVFATQGALLLDATLDGRPLTMESEEERGHPVYSAFVDVAPGAPLVLSLRLRDDTRGRPLIVQPPMIVPDAVSSR
jgi:hypothetical protein